MTFDGGKGTILCTKWLLGVDVCLTATARRVALRQRVRGGGGVRVMRRRDAKWNICRCDTEREREREGLRLGRLGTRDAIWSIHKVPASAWDCGYTTRVRGDRISAQLCDVRPSYPEIIRRRPQFGIVQIFARNVESKFF